MAAPVQLLWEQIGAAIVAINTLLPINSNAVQKCNKVIVYINFGAATTAGTFVVEVSHDPDFTGTWETIGTVAWAAANSAKSVTVNGPHQAMRVRSSVAVVGGSANVWARVLA
jgi:hypothetical protein